jgi:hypothetical protein
VGGSNKHNSFWRGGAGNISEVFTSPSESQSYAATNRQSASCLGVRHPSMAHDQIFIIVSQLRDC